MSADDVLREIECASNDHDYRMGLMTGARCENTGHIIKLAGLAYLLQHEPDNYFLRGMLAYYMGEGV